MIQQVLIPPALRDACAQAGMSPGIVSHDHVFLTGVTGAASDCFMPESEEAQFNACFKRSPQYWPKRIWT